MTITDRMKRLGLERPKDKRKQAKADESPAQEKTMPEDVVEVLPGQLSIEDTDTPSEDTQSTVVDIVPVNALTEPLSTNEVQTLEHYERIITQGIQTFVDVGHALLTIREHLLYRETFTTFEEYCRQRWDLSRPRAYQLIDAAQVIDAVYTIVDIVSVNESQARPLTSLAPAQQVEVLREVVETAPPSGITAQHVKETVKRAKGIPTGTKTQTSKLFDELRVAQRIKDLYMDWLRRCEDETALLRADAFLNTLRMLVEGRAKFLNQTE
jgi:hypothetical protein